VHGIAPYHQPPAISSLVAIGRRFRPLRGNESSGALMPWAQTLRPNGLRRFFGHSLLRGRGYAPTPAELGNSLAKQPGDRQAGRMDLPIPLPPWPDSPI